MGTTHPFTGVGFDSYGDWYRRARGSKALVSPGVNVTSNTAHNVPLDIFAFGGWPLFLAYIGIVVVAGFSIVKTLKRNSGFDPLFASLSAAWICYQLQSLISINQLGLAVWGWLLSGVLIAYERLRMEDGSETTKSIPKAKSRSTKVVTANLAAGIGIVLGSFITWPALNADMKWRSAQTSRDLAIFESSLKPTYLNPQNSYKYGNSIGVLEQSSLFEKARTYALAATKFNPDSFEAWKTLYLISSSTPEEKNLAVRNMKRLDPLNPDVTSTQ
jgi:hypothetical protein